MKNEEVKNKAEPKKNKDEPKRKQGRPKIQIDKVQFEGLCKLQCTEEEIAGWFNCSCDKIRDYCKETYGASFSEVFKTHSQGGKISLRRNLFKLSAKSAPVAIWLSKQYLGMREPMPEQPKDGEKIDDGFIKALNVSAVEDWGIDEEKNP